MQHGSSSEDECSARDLAWQRWVQSRRQRKRLFVAQCIACLAIGTLIGRAYSIATAPSPPSQWWTIQAQPGGFVAGPFEMRDGDGHSLLKVPAGAIFGQSDGPLVYRCVRDACEEGGEIRSLWITQKGG